MTDDDTTARIWPAAIELHGIRLHAVTESRCVELMLEELEAGRGGCLVTHNLDHARRLVRDGQFRDLCTRASLAVADGMPLVWAAAMQGTPLPERVAGSNLVSSIAKAAAGRQRSIFLLGGNPGTADAAAEVLAGRYPRLLIAGTCCPPVGFESDEREMATLTARLRSIKPDIVYVALGSPKQEQLIERVRPILPRAWWIGVGISFSFLSGEVRRAPGWMQRAGLEWVHRLVQEPRRLTRRYLLDGLPFATRLFVAAVRQRFREREQHRHDVSQPL